MYSKKEFVLEFANRIKDFYLDFKKEFQWFSGCVEGVWFDCTVGDNWYEFNDENEDSEDYRDLYSVVVSVYKSFEDYDLGNELEDWQGWMVDFYSVEEIKSLNEEELLSKCIEQWEFSYGMIFI